MLILLIDLFLECVVASDRHVDSSIDITIALVAAVNVRGVKMVAISTKERWSCREFK